LNIGGLSGELQSAFNSFWQNHCHKPFVGVASYGLRSHKKNHMFMKIINLTPNAYMFNEMSIISFIPSAYSQCKN